MHMTLSYRYNSPRVLPCKHHIPGNCSSITMAAVRVNRGHPGSWCLVVLFVDSSGSASPIPSDQPGPLSRSVKLRVSRTCNPLHKFFPHSLLADLWLLSRCLSASGHTTLPTNPVCARNLVIIYMMKYCIFFCKTLLQADRLLQCVGWQCLAIYRPTVWCGPPPSHLCLAFSLT